ncbi:MAG: TIGR04076 family protein [bacterium]|nr:TIGR04076 family protein [bacterium]
MVTQMSNVKITVLRRFSTEEVFKESPVKANYTGPCDVFEDGQGFYIGANEKPVMPDGFCPYAWDVIFCWFVALRSNADFLQWYEEPGVAVTCCPDGLRPVVFKLERVS